MDGILDFSRDLDIGLMDRVVGAMYTSVGADQRTAQQVLAQFQEHPEAWQRVPAILQQSSSAQTKYIALQILDKLITTRWKVLPVDQQQGIRNFIVETIISVSSDEAALRTQKTYINKLDVTLVQILKQEWPHRWPTFISDIVSSSRTSLSICENNMAILRLLSEEIFDYSAEAMTQAKTKNLKNQICGEFADVFQLCIEVLEKAQKPSLIKATLETMLRFLNWIPLGYIFETSVIDHLIGRFLEVPEFRNVTLKCLSEIAGLNVGPEYDAKFVVLFNMVMTAVNRMVPPSTNIAAAYESSSDSDQELVLNLALFLCNFLQAHLKLVEHTEHRDVLLNAHLYLIKVSQVPEREVFKICLEYWSKLVAELYEEIQQLPMPEMNPLLGLNLGNGAGQGANAMNLRKHTYADILSNLRLVMIERMVKPEEVLIVENDEGEIVREFMKESDTIVLYKSMREVLVYLTHLDVADTETIMTEKLSKQVDGSEWSWANLNTLCWAIGSISGAMSEETEKRFLVTVIKDLLGLCEMKRGKDNKAVVASNIMYIVGQYPRFLKAHWKFLKTVVNKNFEFMHETHEGVQDMACDTFIKIAQKCRRHFVMQQSGEQEPFIDEILRTLHRITVDLSPLQVHTFYEAIGYMIAAQPNKPTQERLIAKLMELPNNAWDSLMAQAHSNVDVLGNPENIKILSNVLKTNVSACSSVGTFFLPQIGRIYLDMLALYRSVSGVISAKVDSDGLVATKTPLVRGLRTIKKDILRLVETYVKRAEDLEQVNSNLIPSLLDAILSDYHNNVPAARDAEVLNVVATITGRLGSLLTDKVPPILDAVFEPTLSMINRDFAEYPEHRVGFFKLLRAINFNCFPALLSLEPAKFKLFVDALVWAFKHAQRDVAEQGLSTALELLGNISTQEPSVSGGFYQQYLLAIIQDVFFVLTDSDHKAGFKTQCALLARIFELVESGKVQAPLAEGISDNRAYIRQFCANLLKNAFPHVETAYLEAFVNGLAQDAQDLTAYRNRIRDLLVVSKELSAGEGAAEELFAAEDQEEKRRAAAAADERRAAAVPGMLKPSMVKDEDEEL
ncbi:putative CRM1-nuclear export factor, exportin [Tilletiopsis washingtonensis]|uniref:Putative CRM1-nuclear export factor, exportin n=1 Tax=Tilletiopsis washingtonensis TaxID=58919 RepID=A0A316ZEX6_9BASI|nr:putative CRM1-nuclear export factor, exportin [Tilletiopsis washingtonensis]PWO00318.1 putative CRM1-nuclear export factor, exportin [Tilletiopsis washingtonensis]